MSDIVEQIENKFKWYSLKVVSGKELVAKEIIIFVEATYPIIIAKNPAIN